MGEIIPSESLSRVTYREINSMHSQKTKQPYIRSTRKNRTRKKKSAVEEDPWNRPKKNKKNEPFEQLKINKITKERKALISISKQPWKLLKTKPLKTGRPKNKPWLKKLTSEWILAPQTAQKTTTQSLLERRENFLLQGRLSVLTLISVSVPPPCYHSST